MGDPLDGLTGTVITYTDGHFTALEGVSKTIHEAGGFELREECLAKLRAHSDTSMIITSAGSVKGATHVAHVVYNPAKPFDELPAEALQGIEAATQSDTIVIPFPGVTTTDNQLGAIAGSVIKALKRFESNTNDQRGAPR